MTSHPTLQHVLAARARVARFAVVTPLRPSSWLMDGAGRPVALKLENQQTTGSFKIRGAANALALLDAAARAAGVVAVSSGNHGRAVATVGASLGVDVTICVSSRVPAAKVAAIEETGARVLVAGPDQDDADAAARQLVAAGRTFVHPFDDPTVIAGQGTLGVEVVEEMDAPGTVVVPLSGGGLIAGVALAVKGLAPGARVVGVSQERGPAMYESLRAGRLVDVVEEDTLADALAGGLGPANEHSFQLCAELLDDTVLVSEGEIADAMRRLHAFDGQRVEGGGAVAAAAIAAGRVGGPAPVVAVVSGGNVSDETFGRVVADG